MPRRVKGVVQGQMSAEEYQALQRKGMSEAQFQDSLVDVARSHGYRVHFVPDALYRRSFSGKHKGRGLDLGDRGFPDLVLSRHNHVAYRELKVGDNDLSENQIVWRDILINAGQDWCLWHGDDYDVIVSQLETGLENERCSRYGKTPVRRFGRRVGTRDGLRN